VDFTEVAIVLDLGFLGSVTYQGFCMDSSNTNFPSFDIVAEADQGINDANDCVTECPTDNDYFTGFTFAIGPLSLSFGDFTGNICSCHFSGTTPEDLLYNNPGAVGPITNVLPNAVVPSEHDPEGYCYAFNVSCGGMVGMNLLHIISIIHLTVNNISFLQRFIEPSDPPSANPSSQPSSEPSSEPSSQPSSVPSDQPSSQPSNPPSGGPSCMPSHAPTPSPSIHLFYPDWHSNGINHGCLSDGKQPEYMDVNPSFYLFSSLDKCCSNHYLWNYNSCVGMLDEQCVKELWYPDWHGDNESCLRNGEEPQYMTENKVSTTHNALTEMLGR
jgi:hypothetical protein